jgi:hypothetical protein
VEKFVLKFILETGCHSFIEFVIHKINHFGAFFQFIIEDEPNDP